MLIKIERVLIKENLGVVIVYGDTNATLPDAFASVQFYMPVAHVKGNFQS